MPTALQIAQGMNAPLSLGLFMAVRTVTPLLSAFDARTSQTNKFLTLAVVSLPTSNFVRIGQGLNSSDGNLELREFSCSEIGGMIKAEVESSRLWDMYHQASGYTWFDLQTELRIKADMRNIERQMIQGTANDPLGFPGAKDMTPFGNGDSNVMQVGDSPQQGKFQKAVINAGGTTANTASSVYSFVFGETEDQLLLGNATGPEILRMSPIVQQALAPDPVNAPTALSMHNLAEARGYIGMAVNGFNIEGTGQTIPVQYAVRRIANLTADTGHTLNDQMMDQLKRSHGSGRVPGLFAMSYRSGQQLAKSRAPSAITFFMGESGNASHSPLSNMPLGSNSLSWVSARSLLQWMTKALKNLP